MEQLTKLTYNMDIVSSYYLMTAVSSWEEHNLLWNLSYIPEIAQEVRNNKFQSSSNTLSLSDKNKEEERDIF